MAKALQHRQAALIARIPTACATDNKPVPDTAGSGRSNAIVSQSRWYKKSVRPLPVLFLLISIVLQTIGAVMVLAVVLLSPRLVYLRAFHKYFLGREFSQQFSLRGSPSIAANGRVLVLQ